jgi:hypothetical protein
MTSGKKKFPPAVTLGKIYTFPLSWYGDCQFYNYPTYQRTSSWTWKFGRNTIKIGFFTFNQCVQQQVAASTSTNFRCHSHTVISETERVRFRKLCIFYIWQTHKRLRHYQGIKCAYMKTSKFTSVEVLLVESISSWIFMIFR